VRLHSLLVGLFVLLATAVACGSATAATVCTGDVCVISGGFAGLQADIAGAQASAPVTRLLASEVSLSEALHPPSPCATICVPSVRYLASAYLLVLVDYQAAELSGVPQCSARTIDSDIRTMFADPTMHPAGTPTLPTIPPGPPC
jgi:hypothetical protein